jgi:hypothetical protein
LFFILFPALFSFYVLAFCSAFVPLSLSMHCQMLANTGAFRTSDLSEQLQAVEK